MWIETMSQTARLLLNKNSFASNGECGLKPDSGINDGECVELRAIHSPAMANVD